MVLVQGNAILWVIKGTVSGFLIFVAGGFFYVAISAAAENYRCSRIPKRGSMVSPQEATDVRVLLHHPVLWIAFSAAIAWYEHTNEQEEVTRSWRHSPFTCTLARSPAFA